ncbi:uncharacterized protein LOC110443260 isoform X1 [Mizuhopecten yessoensis]|uniref:uncharacterized protein LOC110443260 isoform X1 n=1 Tax=Mizuhopecten yessoensis TaxID=6573 RepID=UPI000B457313|nr:uncharacterized protein LOC110443260 isoform X1 [Mizuhopecten yessoensis]
MDDRWWNTLTCWCFWLTFPFSFYLHCFGFFSPTWVKWIGCGSQGLFYTVSENTTNTCISDGEYLSPAALGLQATSLVIYPMALCLTWAWIKSSELTWIWLQFTIVLYGVAGLFSLVGCIMVCTIDAGAFSYGLGFFACLINSVYVLIQAIIACYCLGKSGYTGSAHSGVSVASAALKVVLMNFVKMLFCSNFKCERRRNIQHGADV